MQLLPPGVKVQHDKCLSISAQGGDDDWFSYEGEIKFENVMLFDQEQQKILFGYKKEGFGAGYYCPFAGPVMGEEDGMTAAKRDLLEQTGVEAEEIAFMGTVCVAFGGQKDALQCTMYKVKRWTGEPRETQTFIPEWFSPKEIPYNKMFDDDKHWIPIFMEGSRKFAARVDYDRAGEGEYVGKMLRWWFGTYQ